MKTFESEVSILLEFRSMENPVTVSLPLSMHRYLDIYGDRRLTAEGAVVYRQGARARPMPECLLPRRASQALRP